MAYSFQPIDQALDSLGTSYVDGVTVRIASKYCVDCDMEEVKSILKSPSPKVLSFESNYDTSHEKNVLEDFKKRKVEQENTIKERKERIEKYEKDKAAELTRKQKEEEEKALEDERKMLLEIESEKKAKIAEKERQKLEHLKLEEEKAIKQKLEEEAEWKKFEAERLENNKQSEKDATENVDTLPVNNEEALNEQFSTPPEEIEVLSSTQIHVKGTESAQTPKNLQINFSDFEALSDPFADLELKTINDLAELQTILTSNTLPAATLPGAAGQTQHLSSSSTNQQPQQTLPGQPNIQPAIHTSQNFSAGQYQQPGSSSTFYSTIPSQAVCQTQFGNLPLHLVHSVSNQSNFANFPTLSSTNAYILPTPTCTTSAYNHTTPNSAGNPFYQGYSTSHQAFSSSSSTPGIVSSSNTGYNVYNPGQAHPTYQPRQKTQVPTPNQIKESRSISSDRRTEKLKDSSDVPSHGELKSSSSVGDMISQLQKEAQALQDQKRKSPNPNSRPGSRGASGLENWTPWPALDQEHGPSTKQKPIDVVVDDSCLKLLVDDEANLCRQLHEMGFPLPRLAKGCQAVGANSQKLINFCLVVDRLVDEGFTTGDSEEVTMLHNADEDVCRKHLKSFQQLAEIGFPSKDVHQALIASSFDHQKALEQLIG